MEDMDGRGWRLELVFGGTGRRWSEVDQDGGGGGWVKTVELEVDMVGGDGACVFFEDVFDEDQHPAHSLRTFAIGCLSKSLFTLMSYVSCTV